MSALPPLDLLACPVCRSAVAERAPDAPLVCTGCGARYGRTPVGVDLRPSLPEDDRWREWDEKQKAGVVEYASPDSATKAVFDHVAEEFGRYCDFSGKVLDLGCGVERAPAYHAALGERAHVIGVDPLPGPDARAFEFVVGLGEWLPFRDGAFDAVLLATTLDHFVDPEPVLAEAARVLAPTGRIALWVGVLNLEYLRPQPTLRLFARRFATPEGRSAFAASVRRKTVRELTRQAGTLAGDAADSAGRRIRLAVAEQRVAKGVFAARAEHHFNFFTRVDVLDLLARTGFRPERERTIFDRAHGDSLFVVACREAG
jgi:SAM-dependent methyltransferase